MKRSEMLKHIKAVFRAHGQECYAFQDAELSLGRFAEIMAEYILTHIEDKGMMPPKTRQFTDPNDFHGEWSSITDDFKYEWEPENSND